MIENGLLAPDRLQTRSRLPGDKRPWSFGYFGQITPFKGVDTLLDTIELLGREPDIRQRICIRVHGNFIGQDAAFLSRFDEVVSGAGFVDYLGPYDNADVRTLMQACDYVLTPSTWWENSPVVIQEAYAAGRPVICTGIGGLAEKVPNGRSGLHFRLGDASDLARAMSDASEEGLYQTLCSGLPAVADQLQMARDYLACFDRLVPPAGNFEIIRPQRRRKTVAAS